MLKVPAFTLTAKKAHSAAVSAASHLHSLGLTAGDRVAIVTPEHRFSKAKAAELQAHTISISLGCLLSGLVPVMINPLLTEPERVAILTNCKPRLVLSDAGDFERLVEPTHAYPRVYLSQVPLGRPMHYTSGTTGSAKGVWTHDISESESTLLWGEEQSAWEFEPDDRYLLHGPLCHSAPLRFAHTTLLAGGAVITQGWFDAQHTARAMAEVKPTVAFAVPTQLQRLLRVTDVPASPYRLLAHAGAACSTDLKREIHNWAGVQKVWEFYGSTEGQFTACSGVEWEQNPGTVGRPRRRRKLEIVDGTIWCESPDYARFRYWDDEAKTSSATRPADEGFWFTVGDLGRLDDEGYLFIEGRREDLIISGGVNVYPAEVEPVLRAIPGVEEVAVFGIEHPEWGQQVTAVYVGNAKPEDVLAAARDNLAGHKRPKVVHQVAELPHTTSGKIQRNLIAAQLNL